MRMGMRAQSVSRIQFDKLFLCKPCLGYTHVFVINVELIMFNIHITFVSRVPFKKL